MDYRLLEDVPGARRIQLRSSTTKMTRFCSARGLEAVTPSARVVRRVLVGAAAAAIGLAVYLFVWPSRAAAIGAAIAAFADDTSSPIRTPARTVARPSAFVDGG